MWGRRYGTEVEEEATWEKGEGEKANKYVDNAVPVSQSVKLGLPFSPLGLSDGRRRRVIRSYGAK